LSYRHPLRTLLVATLALSLALGAAAWWWARSLPGAGALHQFAPTTVRAGVPFEVKVLAGVWGEGRPADRRYEDWSLQLQQQGQPLGGPVVPASVGREGERLALRFKLLAPPLVAPQPAALTWQLRFVFDGQAQQVAGTHAITVEP